MPDLPRAVSVLLPLALLGVIFAIGIFTYDSDFYVTVIRSELGLIENGTAILALLVAGMAIYAWPKGDIMVPQWFFKLWLGFFILGGFLLAGEEISWGQHFFHWQSPNYFRDENLQSETNIHNLWHLSEIIPKFLLHMAAIFGGIIWPLLVLRGILPAPRPPGFFYWLLPTQAVLTTASIAIGVRIIERILANMDLRERSMEYKEFKELNELFLILFVVYYLASLAIRARAYARIRLAPPEE